MIYSLHHRGFTLVEVLLSLFILFSAIVAFGSAYKLYSDARIKQELYQDIYETILSVKSKIETMTLSEEPEGEGEINSFHYSFKADRLHSVRNFVYGDDFTSAGNKGPFVMELYEVHVMIGRSSVQRDFSFYVTQYTVDPSLFEEF